MQCCSPLFGPDNYNPMWLTGLKAPTDLLFAFPADAFRLRGFQ